MDNKCSKCGKIPATIDYKGSKYCTWYCAKKGRLMWRLCKMEGLTTAISMFGYTVVFGVIGIILYSAFKNNKRRK